MQLEYVGPLFESLVYSLVWIFLSAAMIWLHSLPDGGHKRDLSVGAVFFAARGISDLAYSWGFVACNLGSGLAFHWLSAGIGIMAGGYGAVRVGNFAITLIRSEHIERIERNKVGDGPMEDMMLPLASAALRQGLEDVQQLYEDRGISTCQPRSGTMSLQHSRL